MVHCRCLYVCKRINLLLKKRQIYNCAREFTDSFFTHVQRQLMLVKRQELLFFYEFMILNIPARLVISVTTCA